MKLNEQAIANASAAVTAVLYLVCVLAVLVVPGLFLTIANSWIHGLDLAQIWRPAVTGGSFILGLVTAVGGSWILGWLFAYVYNRLLNQK